MELNCELFIIRESNPPIQKLNKVSWLVVKSLQLLEVTIILSS